MMEKLKNRIFPCSEKMKLAIDDNLKATQRLIDACQPRVKNSFPELKEGHIVSPR